MNYKLLVDTAMLAGEILLCSGAETYRVEDTMYHILKTSNSETIDAIALMTGIIVTVNGESMEQPITMMKRVSRRSTNMSNIIKVNNISRQYCGGELSLEEAYGALKEVHSNQYNRTIYNIGTIGIAAGFAMMFGGQWYDVLSAVMIGALLALVITSGKIIKLNSILVHVLSGIGIALLAVALKKYAFSDMKIEVVIVSSMMPIVPGVAITNAIRDTLQGDYLSGGARILEAFLVAASIAVGVGLGMMGGGM